MFVIALLIASLQTQVVATFNIRYDNPDDGPSAWNQRKERVAEVFERADVVGVQEALRHQVDYLAETLPEFAWFGVGRNDGQQAGEFAPVFYRQDRYVLLSSGTFWLSEHPDEPGSRSWDAALPRICTWGRMRMKDSGQIVWVFNTHFDHRGAEARLESARLIMAKIESMVGDEAALLMGDFNAVPDSPVYATLTSGRLVDTREATAEPPTGPVGTFTGFTVRDDPPGRRIDYVFVPRRASVWMYEALMDLVDGRYVSDHTPVLVRLEFP